MRKIYISLILTCTTCMYLQGQTITPPSVNSRTSFAIIIDEKSLNEAKDEVYAYKKIVEEDGLGAYVIAGEWKNPDEIRNLLIKLHRDKKSPIEGAVFVGDIPVPMLRDAQHLTSAFKMKQTRDRKQSSVASDRFYDDFGLKFDFLQQDSLKPLYFYYSLRADSKQILQPDIYSARIKPLEKGKKDKYTQLREYLKKLVALRTAEKENKIDNLTVARGHGYNSESRVAWSGEQLALREQFPELFGSGNFVKFMDFDSYWPMKPYWLNEVQRTDLDVLLFHHHGSNDYQYINGYKSGSDVNTSKDNIKLYLRSKINAAVNKGNDKEATIKQYMEYLDVPRSWCEEAFDPEIAATDSVMNDNLDIRVTDVLNLAPNARFIMFDACYNGSFHEDEYIAGAYIFNDGKTVVAQGNTVNALQDKWPDEFIGLLNHGLRAGLWGKYVHYLETHIMGDPTFRFAKNSGIDMDVNAALTVRKHDVAFWKKALKYPSADIQAIALRVLFDNDCKDISALLKQFCLNSPYMIVRLEAMQLLSRLNNDDFTAVLPFAVSDSYELTRRFAVEHITKNGSDDLIPALVKSMLDDNTSKRVKFKISSGLKMLDLDKLKSELTKQISAGRVFYDKAETDVYLKDIAYAQKSNAESLATLNDKAAKTKDLAFEISRYRNHPISGDADLLLNMVADAKFEFDLRLAAAEALGWFNRSCKKTYIIERLNKLQLGSGNDEISNEVLKTLNRLKK